MKKFYQKSPKSAASKAKKEDSCMEEVAKLNISKKLLETALSFGIALTLSEQNTEERPPIFRSPENERFYNAVRVPETGGQENPWIRTKGKNSTAYGPVQITVSTVSDYYNRYPDLFKGNEDYVQKFMAQGQKFKQHMNSNDPTFGRGGVGELGAEEHREAYMRLSDAVIQGMRSDMEKGKKMNQGEFNVGVMTQRWRGVPREQDEKYFTAVESGMQQKNEPSPTAPVTPPTVTKPQEPPPQPEQKTPSEEYQVRGGDTLSRIAQKFNTSVESLAKQNNIADPNKIQIGQKLKI
jgi:LysM repeat protein